MAVYNTTFIDNTSGPLVLFQGINDNSGQWFFGSFLIFLWMILSVWFKKNGLPDSTLASSFVVALIAGLGFGIGLLSAWALVFPVVAMTLSIILKVWGEG